MRDGVKKKLDHFFSKFKKLYFKKGEIIIREDSQINGIYYLKKGFVRQYLVTEDGNEITLHVFRPISYFPIMLVLGDAPNKYVFRALTQIEVWHAPKERVVEFIKKDQEILFDLTTRFSKALNGLLVKIENQLFKSAQAKIVYLLIYLGKAFGQNYKSSVSIPVPLTHTEIAHWVGLQRETVSRQMELLKKKGVIKNSRQRIVISNLKKLEEELQKQKKN